MKAINFTKMNVIIKVDVHQELFCFLMISNPINII